MIIPSDIKPDHTVKIFVKYDDIEEELYAHVEDVFSTLMSVRYYTPTSKFYKGAPIYELSEDVEPVEFESLTEHYIEISPLTKVSGNMYYDENEETNSVSSIEDMSDSDSDVGSLDDFIVDDDEVEGLSDLPADHATLDHDWNSWNPSTLGGRKFKDTVDRIEMYARHQADEQEF